MLKRRGRWRTLFGLKAGLWYYDSDPAISRHDPLEKETLAVRVFKDDKLSSFERKTLWIAILSALAAFGAAYFILQQFKQMAAQTDLLSRQLELSERPWVTLDGTFGQVNWEVERAPKFLGKEELTTFMNLQMPMDYALRNTGKSPATRTFISMQAMPTDFGKNFTRPVLPMNLACSAAESERKLAENPESLSHGIVIFPQAAPIRRTWIPAVGFREDNFKTISGVWIAACIVYQAGFSPHVYHTKLWYVSLPTQGVTQFVPIQPDQPFKWHPFDRFVLYDSEAD